MFVHDWSAIKASYGVYGFVLFDEFYEAVTEAFSFFCCCWVGVGVGCCEKKEFVCFVFCVFFCVFCFLFFVFCFLFFVFCFLFFVFCFLFFVFCFLFFIFSFFCLFCFDVNKP